MTMTMTMATAPAPSLKDIASQIVGRARSVGMRDTDTRAMLSQMVICGSIDGDPSDTLTVSFALDRQPLVRFQINCVTDVATGERLTGQESLDLLRKGWREAIDRVLPHATNIND